MQVSNVIVGLLKKLTLRWDEPALALRAHSSRVIRSLVALRNSSFSVLVSMKDSQWGKKSPNTNFIFKAIQFILIFVLSMHCGLFFEIFLAPNVRDEQIILPIKRFQDWAVSAVLLPVDGLFTSRAVKAERVQNEFKRLALGSKLNWNLFYETLGVAGRSFWKNPHLFLKLITPRRINRRLRTSCWFEVWTRKDFIFARN